MANSGKWRTHVIINQSQRLRARPSHVKVQEGWMNIITKASRTKAKSSKQFDAGEVEINDMDTGTHLPRQDRLMHQSNARIAHSG